MPTTTQSELAAALARDLDTAFPELVTATQDEIYSGVRRLVPAAADAEDITQEAYVRAYRALTGYPTARIEALSLRPWLWTIALNLCRNAARSRTRKPPGAPLTAADEPANRDDPAAAAVSSLEEAAWRTRLRTLPAPMRTAVVLKHVAGLSYPEIATAMGRPVGTVKADVHRGLARLRALLESDGEEQP